MPFNWCLLSEYRRRSHAVGLWICIWLAAEELVIICTSLHLRLYSIPPQVDQTQCHDCSSTINTTNRIQNHSSSDMWHVDSPPQMLCNTTVTPWILTFQVLFIYNRTQLLRHLRVTYPHACICNSNHSISTHPNWKYQTKKNFNLNFWLSKTELQ